MTYYGKYRAIVTNSNDPKNMGRIKVSCPKVLGEFESSWCVPCMPLTGKDSGILMTPSKNDLVWIEFEEGDPSKPIWVGGWWLPSNAPSESAEKVLVLKSPFTVKVISDSVEIIANNIIIGE